MPKKRRKPRKTKEGFDYFPMRPIYAFDVSTRLLTDEEFEHTLFASNGLCEHCNEMRAAHESYFRKVAGGYQFAVLPLDRFSYTIKQPTNEQKP